ncbi:MAG: conjugal transfer protein TraG N-terminal domain-containing protein [Pseudomonadota bacterium]
MIRLRPWLGASLGLSVLSPSAPAWAIDGEYVTYGGFDATVSAFQYIALFFGNGEYGGLIFTIATIGLALGAFNAFISNSGRDGNRITVWVITFLFGAGLFTAFIVPKGRVFVVDPVLNAAATINDVPDGIVLIANLASNFQETAVTIADTASPRLYQNTANGALFDIIRKTWTANNPIADEFIWETTKSYFIDCVSIATRMPLTGLTTDELRNSSTDLTATFAKAALNSVFTTTFTSANPQGVTATCAASWTALLPQINNVATYAAFEDAVCSGAGFDPADANQRTRCTSLLDETPALFGAAGDRYSYLRGAALAQAMEEAMADQDPERAIAAETNRRFVEQAGGFFVTAQEYGPFIRAAFFAAAISTLPLLFLFLMTPFFGSVLRLAVGFFAFVALWSIIDVGIAQVAHGIAVAAFEEVARHNMAFTSFMLTPPASVKALAVFGASRFIAISFAALFVVTIFKISGASFASVTAPIVGTATAAGDGASNAVLNPIGRAGTTTALANAGGVGQALGDDPNGTFRAWQTHNAGNISNIAGQVAGGRAASGENSYGRARFGAGVVEGASAIGAASGVSAAAGASLAETGAGDSNAVNATAGAAAQRADVQNRSSVFTASNLKTIADDMARQRGGTSNDFLFRMGNLDNIQRAAQLEAAGGELAPIGNTTRTETSQRIGAAVGSEAGAASQGTTVGNIAGAAANLNAVYGAGEERFLSAANPNDLTSIATSGQLRRDRQVGWVAGVGNAADYTGQSPSEASRSAEAFSAENAIVAASVMRDIGNRHFGDVSAMFAAQAGSNRVFTPTSEDATAMHQSGVIDQTQFEMLANQGGTATVSFDANGSPRSISVQSQDSTTRDESLSIRGGTSIHDTPQVNGDTLFNMAFGGTRARNQFTDMAEEAQENGTTDVFRNHVSMAAASYLSGLSGDEMSITESGSFSASSAVYGDASVGTPKPLAFMGVSARGGLRGSLDSTDGSDMRRVSSFNGNLRETQQLFDETITNDSLGVMTDRVDAYFDGLRRLDGQVHDRQDHVHQKANEPDAAIGSIADTFSRDGDRELSPEDFQELVRRSRFKQPGEM